MPKPRKYRKTNSTINIVNADLVARLKAHADKHGCTGMPVSHYATMLLNEAMAKRQGKVSK